MRAIAVDGGCLLSDETPTAQSIGLLHPGERIDLILDRELSVPSREAALTIELDTE